MLETSSLAVLQAPLPEFNLAVWHGFNTAFVMTLVAFAGGLLFYVMRHHILTIHDRLFPPVSGRNATEALLLRIFQGAGFLNRTIENGSLQRYLLAVVASALVALWAGLWSFPLVGDLEGKGLQGFTAVVALVLAAGTLLTVMWHRRRKQAVVAIGVVGLMVSLLFVNFSAPDLAMTQLLVEFTTVILILLALFFLPGSTPEESSTGQRFRDGVIAAAAGLTMAAITFGVLTLAPESISGFFLAESKPGGGGTNVVNVILVDFRGFDTLGEITVLGIAALGVLAMLAAAPVSVARQDTDGRPWSNDRHPVILAAMVRPLLPLALLVAVYLFLRGHNLPGGGFIAALVAGTALILQYVSDGSELAQRRLGWNYSVLIGIGLVIAISTGLGSWVIGLSLPDVQLHLRGSTADRYHRARHCAVVRPRRIYHRRRHSDADARQSGATERAARHLSAAARHARRGGMNGAGLRTGHRGAGNRRRLPDAARTHLRGRSWAHAARLRRQSLPVRIRPPDHGQRATDLAGRQRPPGPAAAGTGSDRDRDRFRHDRFRHRTCRACPQRAGRRPRGR